MIDSFKYKGLRKNLVNELREKGIKDELVLAAIETVPRHFFMENVFHHNFAYSNKAFQIGEGQTISHPYTVAFQTELLELKKGQKVLEIGTGSGYQTSILCELGAKVFSVERYRSLHMKAKKILQTMKYRADMFYGDGYIGLENFAPFDKIIVTAGAPYVPEALKTQLKVGGILIIPVGEGETQEMLKIVKLSETEFNTQQLGPFQFVPLLENKQG